METYSRNVEKLSSYTEEYLFSLPLNSPPTLKINVNFLDFIKIELCLMNVNDNQRQYIMGEVFHQYKYEIRNRYHTGYTYSITSL